MLAVDLGLPIAAAVTALGTIIVALLAKSSKRSADRDAVLEDIRSKLQTNGSKKDIGQLVELVYTDLQTTKRDLAEHERSTNVHGLHIWEQGQG